MKLSILALGTALAFLAPQSLFAESTLATSILTPQKHHITVDSLPEPYSTTSAIKRPSEVEPPENAALNIPSGFAVNIFTDDLINPRSLAISPEGDLLVVESYKHRIYRLVDSDRDGKADKKELFANEDNGLNQPFGISFSDRYVFIASTDKVSRFDYKKGQNKVTGNGKQVIAFESGGYHQHWTRNVIVSPDQQWIYVSMGSESNADEELPPRAAITKMKLDGSEPTLFASGLRNPLGLAFHPHTNELYATVNERDNLGDDLVPDYITHVQKNGFYGWPYAYFVPKNLDPRHVKNGKSTRPDKAADTLTPDVLLQAHSAVMEMAFGEKTNFPAYYKTGLFAALRGSWNRAKGTGYKIIYVPFDASNRPVGGYEDFLTGFLTDERKPEAWGRPVGVTVLNDGSLVFADEVNGRIYRISYTGIKS